MKHTQHHPSVELALHELKHLLPSQGPLKDFIHHNTLHAYQQMPFHQGLEHCARLTGVKVYLSKNEFFEKKKSGAIDSAYLEHEFRKIGIAQSQDPINPQERKILHLRRLWKKHFHLDLDGRVHSTLFRWLGGYLDQGIAMWRFPAGNDGFLQALRKMDKDSYFPIFSSKRAQKLFHNTQTTIEDLLALIVGDESLYGLYIFDQQFAHPGWSGLVSVLEHEGDSLLARRKISLEEIIFFELLLELNELDVTLGENRTLLAKVYTGPDLAEILKPSPSRVEYAALQCWQEAYEKTYYNEVLRALHQAPLVSPPLNPDFQAVFCLDDREGSLRRYIESLSTTAETFGSPGFFGVDFFYQPENSYHVTKLCPAPLTPKHLVKQSHSKLQRKKDLHLESSSHSFVGGWLISQTLGFWSAMKLFAQIFKPSLTPATATSLRHMDKISQLTVENQHEHHHEHGLQVGFTVPEMADRVYNMLYSIGLTQNFAHLVYLVSHGSSSVNNPHYAAYDCGACSGRPGSVNARVFAHMANHDQVREVLKERGLLIPRTTLFVGALHDTTRDEIEFFEEQNWPQDFLSKHKKNIPLFQQALALNARERSRRFLNTPLNKTPENYNQRVKTRSVSLFEPRPELNHATNSLCIVGRRALTKHVFLDRRAFLNSYDAALDPEGHILTRILGAAVPVCGGINLEYYFSRVDNQKLGAGSKLPHNVMGLVGVANGIDGDLRPGLPSQMIEVHDPVRLLIIVEQRHDVALQSVQRNPATYEWVKNEWVRFASIDPKSKDIHFFSGEQMVPFTPQGNAPVIENLLSYIQTSRENLSVGLLKVQGAQ